MVWNMLFAWFVLFVMYSVHKKKPWVQSLVYELHINYLGVRGVFEDWIYRSDNRLEFKSRKECVAIVTGGSRGIGVLISKLLVKCDVTVIIACRNKTKGENVAKQILRDNNSNIETIKVYELNLASLESVRQFAENVSQEYPAINYLINNAGIMFGPYKETVDGYESQLAVNYLGHFLLTHLLLPNLKKGAEKVGISSRVVNVTSIAHEVCSFINLADINFRNNYMPNIVYGHSKLLQIVFSKYLNHLMRSENSNVEVFAVHPGIVDTELFNSALFKKIAPWLTKLFKSAKQGAIPIVHTCVSDAMKGWGGSYISNCKIMQAHAVSDDVEQQEKLFNLTNKLLRIDKFGVAK